MPQLARLTDDLYVGNFQSCNDDRFGAVVHLHFGEPANKGWCAAQVPRRKRLDFYVPQQDHKLPLYPATLDVLRLAWRLRGGRPLLVHCAAGMRRSPLACAYVLTAECGWTVDRAREVLTAALATYTHPTVPAVVAAQWEWLRATAAGPA